MSISEKTKACNNKIEQNKAQYYLDGQTAKISALSSGNVSKSEYLHGKDVLLKEELLEKAAALKRFEYSPLGKKLKAQTSAVEKIRQYRRLEKDFESNKKKEKAKRSRAKSNPVYSKDFIFYKYHNINEFSERS